jgi:hypothetical protein
MDKDRDYRDNRDRDELGCHKRYIFMIYMVSIHGHTMAYLKKNKNKYSQEEGCIVLEVPGAP